MICVISQDSFLYLFTCWYVWIVHFHTLEPSTFILIDRPLWYFWTVQFDSFGPSTFIQMIVHFDPGPSTRTVHFDFNDRPLWLKIVHFRGTVYFNDHLLWLISPLWTSLIICNESYPRDMIDTLLVRISLRHSMYESKPMSYRLCVIDYEPYMSP